jgi:hypothetical protein
MLLPLLRPNAGLPSSFLLPPSRQNSIAIVWDRISYNRIKFPNSTKSTSTPDPGNYSSWNDMTEIIISSPRRCIRRLRRTVEVQPHQMNIPRCLHEVTTTILSLLTYVYTRLHFHTFLSNAPGRVKLGAAGDLMSTNRASDPSWFTESLRQNPKFEEEFPGSNIHSYEYSFDHRLIIMGLCVY